MKYENKVSSSCNKKNYTGRYSCSSFYFFKLLSSHCILSIGREDKAEGRCHYVALESGLPKLPLIRYLKALKTFSFCEEPKRHFNNDTFKLIIKKYMRHHGPICVCIGNVCTEHEHGVLFETVKIKHCWHLLCCPWGKYFLPQLEGNTYSVVNILTCTVFASDEPGSYFQVKKMVSGAWNFSGIVNFSQDRIAGLVAFRKNPMLYN